MALRPYIAGGVGVHIINSKLTNQGDDLKVDDIRVDGVTYLGILGMNLKLTENFFLFGKYSYRIMSVRGMKVNGQEVPAAEIRKRNEIYEMKSLAFGLGVNF